MYGVLTRPCVCTMYLRPLVGHRRMKVMVMVTKTAAVRDQRINVRASAHQEQLLRQAAAVSDRTLTAFILDSAIEQAERVLADQRWFVVSEEQWDEFQTLLNAPVERWVTTRLVESLKEPSPFADE